MANYKSQKDIISEIASNLEKLEGKKMSLEALESHVGLVRELYERTIVLRYKIFEEKATNEKEVQEEKVVAVIPEKEVVLENTKIEVLIPKQEEIKEKTSAKTEIVDELPTIDFSLFDEPAEEKVVEPKSKIKEVIQEKDISKEPVTEKEPEPVVEKVKEKIEEKVVEEVAPKVTSSVSSNRDFDKKFDMIVKEMKGQFGFSKLETLVGAFGLNERLQFINELFDGSSEKFSDAIKEIDKCKNSGDAKTICIQFSTDYRWELDSETVDEFIQKVCRRYV